MKPQKKEWIVKLDHYPRILFKTIKSVIGPLRTRQLNATGER